MRINFLVFWLGTIVCLLAQTNYNSSTNTVNLNPQFEAYKKQNPNYNLNPSVISTLSGTWFLNSSRPLPYLNPKSMYGFELGFNQELTQGPDSIVSEGKSGWMAMPVDVDKGDFQVSLEHYSDGPAGDGSIVLVLKPPLGLGAKSGIVARFCAEGTDTAGLLVAQIDDLENGTQWYYPEELVIVGKGVGAPLEPEVFPQRTWIPVKVIVKGGVVTLDVNGSKISYTPTFDLKDMRVGLGYYSGDSKVQFRNILVSRSITYPITFSAADQELPFIQSYISAGTIDQTGNITTITDPVVNPLWFRRGGKPSVRIKSVVRTESISDKDKKIKNFMTSRDSISTIDFFQPNLGFINKKGLFWNLLTTFTHQPSAKVSCEIELTDSSVKPLESDVHSFLPALFAYEKEFRKIGEQFSRGAPFQCTVYYTCLESGFTKERKFTSEGLNKIPVDGIPGLIAKKAFLDRVGVEGFGKLEKPFEEKSYIAFDTTKNSFYLASHPVGNNNNELIPRVSCAVDINQIPYGAIITTLNARIQQAFQTSRWRADDVGGAIGSNHIDLYWGEDDPRSFKNVSFPAGITYSGSVNSRVTLEEMP